MEQSEFYLSMKWFVKFSELLWRPLSAGTSLIKGALKARRGEMLTVCVCVCGGVSGKVCTRSFCLIKRPAQIWRKLLSMCLDQLTQSVSGELWFLYRLCGESNSFCRNSCCFDGLHGSILTDSAANRRFNQTTGEQAACAAALRHQTDLVVFPVLSEEVMDRWDLCLRRRPRSDPSHPRPPPSSLSALSMPP